MGNIGVMGWKSALSPHIKHNVFIMKIGYVCYRVMGNIRVMRLKSASSPLGRYNIHHKDHLI